MGNSLPAINSLPELLPALKIWQQTLNTLTNSPVPPRPPFNFRAIGGAVGVTGIALNWEVVQRADGYEIQSSSNGDFSTAAIIAALTSSVATSWFDSTATSGVKRYYRIRSTVGTTNSPHTIKGSWTAPISNTSGSGTTTYDNVSSSSGAGGWSNGNNPGIGPRSTGRSNTL